MSHDTRLTRLELELGQRTSVVAATAADFMTGGAPVTAEAYDRKGVMLEAFERCEGESVPVFRTRVREAAKALPGAMRVKLGGLPQQSPVLAHGRRFPAAR